MTRADELVLGVDGGGTKTVAWLARRDARWLTADAEHPPDELLLGQGAAGPVNLQSVGLETTCENLDRAIVAAFMDAGVTPGRLFAAVLAMAGSDRAENRRAIQSWAEARQLSARLEVVHDALPVLAAGAPQGRGVALIAGTGSLAFGRNGTGETARAGGWGYLFGDEGSGYQLGVAALRAAAKAADGRGPATVLQDRLLERFGLSAAEGLVSFVYPWAGDRGRIAALAEIVVATAKEGDAVAEALLEMSASSLAEMVAAVARRLALDNGPFPLALAGGLLTGENDLRERLARRLRGFGLQIEQAVVVRQPVLGAVRLAQALV
ncbi:MAG: N-acetylglucosamine kinase [Planctomycetota bacterium]